MQTYFGNESWDVVRFILKFASLFMSVSQSIQGGEHNNLFVNNLYCSPSEKEES